MAKILFFNPSSRKNVYLNTNVKVGAPSYPSLTLATLAGNLIKNHEVIIVDLDSPDISIESLFIDIKKFKPDFIATTAKTPDFPSVKKIVSKIKIKFPKIITIIGGVHVTAMPKEAISCACFDIIVIGEADYTLKEILDNHPLGGISGIYYRKNNKYIFTGARKLIANLDKLPYPAWDLFDLKKYRNSRLSSRKNPVGHIETSRGCAYRCNFCSKLIFGTFYRTKSAKRVVDEMEYMLKCGFKEIHVADDSFTQNINRAKDICKEIIKRELKFPFSLINGVRVNLVDAEFFQIAKRAGCWQSGFGIESGDQNILDQVNKKIKLNQVIKSINLAHKAGIETFGFFIFGLKGEIEESLLKTIEFSKLLPLDIAKYDICIPYPGTDYYQELESKGKILSKDWEKYICHQIDKPLFEHENLSWKVIGKYYKKAFKEYYLRPKYIISRLFRDIKKGDLFYDIAYFLQTKW